MPLLPATSPLLQQTEYSHTQDMSANDCFKPVSKYWDRINRPEQLISSMLEAMRVLTSPSETGAVTISLPHDVQAETYEFPGLPEFMKPETVREIFREQTGILPQDLHWFMVYAGLRHAIIMSRINDRSVHFGQAAWTKDVDEAIPHRNLLWTLME